jgi:hypothetical protein
MHGKCVRNKSRQPDEWYNDPVTLETIKENIACCNKYDRTRIKPKEHPYIISWPKIVSDPLHKSAIQHRLIKNMNNICGEERPKKNAQKCDGFHFINFNTSRTKIKPSH